MADMGGPDIALRRAELEHKIAQQELNLRATNVRRLQLTAELGRLDANDEATRTALSELAAELSAL